MIGKVYNAPLRIFARANPFGSIRRISVQTQKQFISRLAVLGGVLALAGCAVPGQYPYYQQQPAQPVYQQPTGAYQGGAVQSESGRVTNVQYIPATNNSSATNIAGTIAGGAIGGIAGHQVGGGSGRTAATILGAVGGALVGQALAQNATAGQQQQGVYRVTVQFDDGSVRAFDYAQPPSVQIGDRVRSDGNQLFR
jgi:outer membrane lipoprotein SlyB